MSNGSFTGLRRLTAAAKRAREKNERLRARWDELRQQAGRGKPPPDIIVAAAEERHDPNPSTQPAQVRHDLPAVVACSSVEPPRVPPDA
jgi:hypothetical protein